MPIYDIACEHCQEKQTFWGKYEEAQKQPCPQCKEPMAIQIPKNTGLVFKGSGFYKTDYPKGGK